MDKVTEKKAAIIQQITQYVVVNGLSDIGLRKLAAISDTSDRMLIYYFGTKDALIGQVLHTVASTLAQQLDTALGEHLRKPDVLLQDLLALSHNPEFDLVVRLWFEVVGLAVRGHEPYASNATAIASNWLQWVVSRLEEPYAEQAVDLFAKLEGQLMLAIIDIAPS